MLAELGADTGQQDTELERLGHVIIGPEIKPEDRVGLGVSTREAARAARVLVQHAP